MNATLKTNSLFVFNLRLEEDFQLYWSNSNTHIVREDYAWIAEHSYYHNEKIGQIKITGFQRIEEKWERLEKILLEKSYSREEVQAALKTVGFREITVHEAKQSEYTYFLSRK